MENTLKFCKANTNQIDESAGIVPFVMTSFNVDESGDVMNPLGALLDEFAKNPISLWMHQMFDVPPSKVLPETIKQTSQIMDGNVQFDLSDPFGEFLFGKYVNGFLSAGSIRFVPIEFTQEIVLEGQTGFFFRIWKLKEFSLVTLPDNVDALRKEYKDGKQGLYQSYEKPYYSAIEKFYEYHNRDLDIDKQIFSFCTGAGCNVFDAPKDSGITDWPDTYVDISQEKIIDDEKENGTIHDSQNKKDNKADIIIPGSENIFTEILDVLKSIENNLKQPENLELEIQEDSVSDQQFLEMLKSHSK